MRRSSGAGFVEFGRALPGRGGAVDVRDPMAAARGRVVGGGGGGGVDGLFVELWKACAGPLAAVPAVGERVFYFPQGHIEQTSAERIRWEDWTSESLVLRIQEMFLLMSMIRLLIRAKSDGTLRTLMNVKQLFDRIKSSERIWFVDEEQLVVNVKKVEQELKWPDIDESWESLISGITQLLTGISVHIVVDSTDISEAVAKEIAEGIGYLPVCTRELLESATQKPIDTCKILSFC